MLPWIQLQVNVPLTDVQVPYWHGELKQTLM